MEILNNRKQTIKISKRVQKLYYCWHLQQKWQK